MMAARARGQLPPALRAIVAFDRREALPHIAVPTLVLAGEHDRTAPPEVMQRMAQRIPARGMSACLERRPHRQLEQPRGLQCRRACSFLQRPLPPLRPVEVRATMHIAGNPQHLTAQQRELIDLAAMLGREQFAPRAAAHDRDASFPFENYDDLRAAGLLGICVPASTAAWAPTSPPT